MVRPHAISFPKPVHVVHTVTFSIVFEAIVLNPSDNRKQYEKGWKRHRLCTVFALVYVHMVLFLEAFYVDLSFPIGD
jgi:predicted nucleotide-binding protein (sugar kinase/HSP70/actin superfamily)